VSDYDSRHKSLRACGDVYHFNCIMIRHSHLLARCYLCTMWLCTTAVRYDALDISLCRHCHGGFAYLLWSSEDQRKTLKSSLDGT
jgi:hypothetical protein